jgi:hypothetical protein
MSGDIIYGNKEESPPEFSRYSRTLVNVCTITFKNYLTKFGYERWKAAKESQSK